MTSEETTTPALVSRRTILRTGANAAWMVPAISIATAVPAMAACSTATAPHFTVTGPSKSAVTSSGILGANKAYTQTYAVKATGTPGDVFLTLTFSNAGLLTPLLGTWDVTGGSGWTPVGSQGTKKTTYQFKRTFGACGEEVPAQFNIKYSVLSGGLSGEGPNWVATWTPQ